MGAFVYCVCYSVILQVCHAYRCGMGTFVYCVRMLCIQVWYGYIYILCMLQCCTCTTGMSCLQVWYHRVQRLMLSNGAKRWIWDDITWFLKYFCQMTIARSEDINKDYTFILNLLKIFPFPKTLQYSFNRGNSNSKILYRSVCDAEIFNDHS